MSDDVNAAQYLTFTLDGEQFAVDICSVREVLEFKAATKVPRTPDFMRGVINLRGSVVPVIDLRLKLGLGATQATIDTSVIIIEVASQSEKLVLGALADSVQEVVTIDRAQVVPPPKMGTRVELDFLRGIAKRDEQFVMILDIARVLTGRELRDAVDLGAAQLPPVAAVPTSLEVS